MTVTHCSAHETDRQWSALADWYDGTRNLQLWSSLAWYDTVLRYRRSVLGPLWITLTMGAMLVGMGPLYSVLFNVSPGRFFPHLALGIIFWTFMSTCINDGCTVFIHAARYLKQSDFPGSVFVWRSLCRNVIQLAHHAVLFVPVALWADISPSVQMLLFIPGLIIVLINLHALQVIVGFLCARFRDGAPLIASILQLLFFLTPVFWLPESLPQRTALVMYNPLAILLETMRQPLLGTVPSSEHWASLFCITLVTTGFAAWSYLRNRRWVAYWV